MKDQSETNRLFFLLAISVVQILISSLLLNYLSMENWSAVFAEDSEGYILAARFFSGLDAPPESLQLLKYRLFSPLIPLLASLIGRIVPLEYAFFILNCFLWIAAVYLVYRLSEMLLNPQLAYCSALLFATSLPLIVWGLPIMVDMASFFMAALSCLLIINGSHKKAAWPLLALTLALAILTKPNLISLVLFFVFYAGGGKEYGKAVLVTGVSLSLVGGIYLLLGLRLEDFLTLGYLRHRGPVYVANALVFCFHWGLPLAAWGFTAAQKHRSFYLTYLLSAFGCYLAFVHNPRLLFITFPAVLPLVVQGMELLTRETARRWSLHPQRFLTSLTVGYMLTSNILAALYLYITRVLQYRSVESITNFPG
jgi:4-amino-4-deoxy-L-arabinose transferase-like glycosyltransferase